MALRWKAVFWWEEVLALEVLDEAVWVVLLASLFALAAFSQGLEAGCLGAEVADLLGEGFGDEVAHAGILS